MERPCLNRVKPFFGADAFYLLPNALVAEVADEGSNVPTEDMAKAVIA